MWKELHLQHLRGVLGVRSSDRVPKNLNGSTESRAGSVAGKRLHLLRLHLHLGYWIRSRLVIVLDQNACSVQLSIE